MAENRYLAQIEREAGIRKGLIIYGNTHDLVNDYTRFNYCNFTEVLTNVLGNKFETILHWNQVDGLKRVKGVETVIEDLKNNAIQTPIPQQDNQIQIPDDFAALEQSISDTTGNENIQFADYLMMIYRHITSDTNQKYAFIIDWSDYLFSDERSFNDQERNLLTLIWKSLTETPYKTDFSSAAQPSNIVVFLSNNIAKLPHSLYVNNPFIKQINIPLPSRKERKDFLQLYGNGERLNVLPQLVGNDIDDFVDSMEGFTLQEMEQVIRLSRQVESPLSATKLLNLYRYGEKTSHWEELSRDKLLTIADKLKERVKGQDEAVEKVKEVVIRAYTGFSGIQHSSNNQKPKGILFFVGPTGVGKTELAKSLAQFLFGDENACIRFDMSEYSSEHSDQRLIGAPPGYVGYEEGGQLTNSLKQKPFSVLLFDEIEKAHGRIMDKFLQILEDGRLTDGRGETVSFGQSIIIFTSNIGASEVSPYLERDQLVQEYNDKIREHFSLKLGRPELLNRLGDNIVVFNGINNPAFLAQIAKTKLAPIQQFLKERYKVNLNLANETELIQALTSQSDKGHGGRGILNQLESMVINPLSLFIFDEGDKILPNSTINVYLVGEGVQQEVKFIVTTGQTV